MTSDGNKSHNLGTYRTFSDTRDTISGLTDVFLMRWMQAALDSIVSWMEQYPPCIEELGGIGVGLLFSRIVALSRVQLSSFWQRAVRGLALFLQRFGNECSIDPGTASQFFSRLFPMLSDPGKRDALSVLVRGIGVGAGQAAVSQAIVAAGGFSLLAGILAAGNPLPDPEEADLAACGLMSLAQLAALGPQETEAALLAVLELGLNGSTHVFVHTGGEKTGRALRLPALIQLMELSSGPSSGQHDGLLRNLEDLGALLRQLRPSEAPAKDQARIELLLSGFAGRSPENQAALANAPGGQELLAAWAEKAAAEQEAEAKVQRAAEAMAQWAAEIKAQRAEIKAQRAAEIERVRQRDSPSARAGAP